VQSRERAQREVDWCQSAAMLVRREAAEQVDYLDADFFVYSTRSTRVAPAHGGLAHLYVPARWRCTTSSSPRACERRIVELFAQPRLYMRKHHSAAAARAVRWLTAWSYAVSGRSPRCDARHAARRYWRHVGAPLRPGAARG